MTNETQVFQILQKTQLALLKSYFVMSEAVRDPKMADLPAIAGEEDPVQWLTDQISVQFPQESEVLQISMSGDENPEDLRTIVDAVASAYENRVVFAERKK